jgi:ribosomal protein S18 acetylase RimI-like enzyme
MPASTIATRPEPAIRPATPADVADMARLVDLASEGMVRQFWAEMAEPGEDVFAVGARRAARDEGAFSWRNAWVAELGDAVAGLLVGYRIGDTPEPVDEAPPMIRGLVELENAALGSWYVNVLATYEPYRGRGVATALLRHAARTAEGTAMSLIVADGNATARRLYEGFGFVEADRRPIVHDGWESASREWVLMLRPAG